MSAVDVQALRGWIGRQETRSDTIFPTPVAQLSATLARGTGNGSYSSASCSSF